MKQWAQRQAAVCPWWVIRSFDNPARRFVHPPESILGGFVRPGDECLDVGCGYGYFTIPMAKLVGPAGSVTAVDVQPQMLNGVARRARHAGVTQRVRLCLAGERGLSFDQSFDAALAFWMLHETPHPETLLGQLHAALKPGGRLLLAEPKGHVTRPAFERALDQARRVGFTVACAPQVALSRTAFLCRSNERSSRRNERDAGCARKGPRTVPFSVNRRMAAASAAVCRERNTIHTLTEVDVTEPRRLLRAHRERTGERLSMTGYVVTCLARAVAEQPSLNAFRRGGRLHLLDGVTIGTLVERRLDGECVPEPFGIRDADRKTYREINDEIRAAQRQADLRLGGLSGATWVRFVPSILFRPMIKVASRSTRMAQRYGVIAVTAVGMFGHDALWLVPLSGSTIAVAVGSIVQRPVQVEGRLEMHEHLCLTISFDHDIVDGAPAARFTARLGDLLTSGDAVREAAPPAPPG